MEDDGTLVRRIALGDVEALGRLYDRHGSSAYRTARRIPLGHHEAEEVVQETFLRVHRGAGSYRGGSVKVWVARIALNLARDRLRRRSGARTEACSEPAIPDPDGDRSGLKPLVESLPIDLRAVLVLRYWEGMTFQETAAALGVSLRTAKYRAARALESMRRKLDED